RDVTATDTSLVVEASFARPNGRVDRAQSQIITAVPRGINQAGEIVLPSATSARPPYILFPPELIMSAGTTLDINFIAEDPDSNQPVQVTMFGPRFATLLPNGRTVRFTPSASDIGLHSLTLTLESKDPNSVGVSVLFRVTVVGGVGGNRPPL